MTGNWSRQYCLLRAPKAFYVTCPLPIIPIITSSWDTTPSCVGKKNQHSSCTHIYVRDSHKTGNISDILDKINFWYISVRSTLSSLISDQNQVHTPTLKKKCWIDHLCIHCKTVSIFFFWKCNFEKSSFKVSYSYTGLAFWWWAINSSPQKLTLNSTGEWFIAHLGSFHYHLIAVFHGNHSPDCSP